MLRQTKETFWAKVKVGKPDECWPWLGARNNGGYGNVVFNQKCYVTHRVAFALGNYDIPYAAPKDRKTFGFVLHSCDNRACCNPAHLHLGTLSDNMFEAYERARKAQPKGERHANAKLSNEEANELREKYRNKLGDTVTLSVEYGISQRAAWLIVNDRTYRNEG